MTYAAYSKLIIDEAKKQGVDPALALSIAEQESNFNPKAKSNMGAVGLFQLMPSAAIDMGIKPADRLDPKKNISAGIGYLKKQIDAAGSLERGLEYYNRGAANANSDKPIPEETINYKKDIFERRLPKYQQLLAANESSSMTDIPPLPEGYTELPPLPEGYTEIKGDTKKQVSQPTVAEQHKEDLEAPYGRTSGGEPLDPLTAFGTDVIDVSVDPILSIAGGQGAQWSAALQGQTPQQIQQAKQVAQERFNTTPRTGAGRALKTGLGHVFEGIGDVVQMGVAAPALIGSSLLKGAGDREGAEKYGSFGGDIITQGIGPAFASRIRGGAQTADTPIAEAIAGTVSDAPTVSGMFLGGKASPKIATEAAPVIADTVKGAVQAIPEAYQATANVANKAKVAEEATMAMGDRLSEARNKADAEAAASGKVSQETINEIQSSVNAKSIAEESVVTTLQEQYGAEISKAQNAFDAPFKNEKPQSIMPSAKREVGADTVLEAQDRASTPAEHAGVDIAATEINNKSIADKLYSFKDTGKQHPDLAQNAARFIDQKINGLQKNNDTGIYNSTISKLKDIRDALAPKAVPPKVEVKQAVRGSIKTRTAAEQKSTDTSYTRFDSLAKQAGQIAYRDKGVKGIDKIDEATMKEVQSYLRDVSGEAANRIGKGDQFKKAQEFYRDKVAPFNKGELANIVSSVKEGKVNDVIGRLKTADQIKQVLPFLSAKGKAALSSHIFDRLIKEAKATENPAAAIKKLQKDPLLDVLGRGEAAQALIQKLQSSGVKLDVRQTKAKELNKLNEALRGKSPEQVASILEAESYKPSSPLANSKKIAEYRDVLREAIGNQKLADELGAMFAETGGKELTKPSALLSAADKIREQALKGEFDNYSQKVQANLAELEANIRSLSKEINTAQLARNERTGGAAPEKGFIDANKGKLTAAGSTAGLAGLYYAPAVTIPLVVGGGVIAGVIYGAKKLIGRRASGEKAVSAAEQSGMAAREQIRQGKTIKELYSE